MHCTRDIIYQIRRVKAECWRSSPGVHQHELVASGLPFNKKRACSSTNRNSLEAVCSPINTIGAVQSYYSTRVNKQSTHKCAIDKPSSLRFSLFRNLFSCKLFSLAFSNRPFLWLFWSPMLRFSVRLNNFIRIRTLSRKFVRIKNSKG